MITNRNTKQESSIKVGVINLKTFPLDVRWERLKMYRSVYFHLDLCFTESVFI